MPVFQLTLEYDGTDFEGWQRQPEGHRTVQATLEAALSEIVGGPVTVGGAGRTDAGVHAEGQVAAARIETRLDAETLARATNAKLPEDVAVVRAEVAPDDFDPRRHARWKHYRYQVWTGRVRSPLRARRWAHHPAALELAPLRAAAAACEGTQDFASFQAARTPITETVRTLHRIRIREEGPALVFDCVGSGFLKHMVRNLVGTWLEAGRGRYGPAEAVPEGIQALLAARDRTKAGPTAPAAGLTLVEVGYDTAVPAWAKPEPPSPAGG